MKFSRAEPDSRYSSLRLVSDGGRWELGLSEYASGVRIRMGLAGRPPSVIDFCLGHNRRFPEPTLLAVIARLEGSDESASPEAIDALFPWARTRPDLRVHLGPLLADAVPAFYKPLE